MSLRPYYIYIDMADAADAEGRSYYKIGWTVSLHLVLDETKEIVIVNDISRA